MAECNYYVKCKKPMYGINPETMHQESYEVDSGECLATKNREYCYCNGRIECCDLHTHEEKLTVADRFNRLLCDVNRLSESLWESEWEQCNNIRSQILAIRDEVLKRRI